MNARWCDHYEHRLVLTRHQCDGRPAYEGGTDQAAYCADGCIRFGGRDDDPDSFHLPVGKLAEFVRTLYEAAGKAGPVIPVPEPSRDGTETPLDRISLHPSLNGPLVAVDWHPDVSYLTPGDARTVAAVLAAYADAAEAMDEPDPADVEALTEAISAGMAHCGGGDAGACRAAATVALRWMRRREAE